MTRFSKSIFIIFVIVLTFSFIKIHQFFNKREYLEADGEIFNIVIFDENEEFYFEKIKNIKSKKMNFISKVQERCIENTDPYLKRCYKMSQHSSGIKFETKEQDNDSIIWSYYLIENDEIVPKRIKKSSFDIVFPSMASAFILVLLLYLTIFFLRKWFNKRKHELQIDEM